MDQLIDESGGLLLRHGGERVHLKEILQVLFGAFLVDALAGHQPEEVAALGLGHRV